MEKDHTTPVASPDRLLRRARLATFAFFGLNGFVMGVWVVHIPAVEDRAGVSHAVLGWLLLLMGAGAFAGLQLCGPLSDRFGARRTVPAAGLLCAGTLVLPGLAGDMTALTAAMVVLGFANGCMDVSMNTHAVQVERGYGRPVMSAFHAVFSVGGVAAALVGARTISWGWSVPLTLGSVGVLGALTALAAAPLLLPPEPGRGEPGSVTPDDAAAPGSADRDHAAADTAGKPAARQPAPRPAKPRTPRRVWGMALLALILMLSEGVAYDWSVLHVQEVLDAPAATAALAYGCFATAMTVGRFTTDRIAARFGPVFVVRYGAGTAAVGLTVVALAPFIPLALVGWTVFGIGLSGCAPQFFSAAGHVDRDASGANVSRVAGLGYMGMLAGPAIIGPMTHLMPLNLTFFLPVAFCVTAVFTAQILRPPSHVASGSGTPAARRGTESAVERSA